MIKQFVNKDTIIKCFLIIMLCLFFSLLFNHFTQKHPLFNYTAPYKRPYIDTAPPLDYDKGIFIDYDGLLRIKSQPDHLIIDTRSFEDYEYGHIPGSVPFPVYEFDRFFDDFVNKYPPFLTLVLYCSDIHCDMALELYYMLINTTNFDNILIYKGGYFEYLEKTNHEGKTRP